MGFLGPYYLQLESESGGGGVGVGVGEGHTGWRGGERAKAVLWDEPLTCGI